MCGIAGFTGEDRAKVSSMIECLRHRGPDGEGVFVGQGISLGQARLAILDPSPLGDQPMWNDSKTAVIVYNGEVVNFRRLREEEGFECTSGSDTEVLLKLYDKYGIGFVERLIGMFAFALYDTRTRTLHLVRDMFGIKPLYISNVEGKMHFASEMRTLMKALPKKPALNMRALSAFMTLQYVPGPETLCEGIESLPQGTILSVKDGKETRRSFEQKQEAPKNLSRTEFLHEFPEVMGQAVEDHTISDKPVGIFLSGGMDSSIVLHHMAKARSTPVKTFTVRFEATEAEDAPRFNRDADLAQKTAKYYGTDHEELLLTANDYRRLYRETTKFLDLPNADSVAVAQYALARMAKKKVDVVLTGAGGDELFGGYPRFRVFRILEALKWMPANVRAYLGSLFGHPSDVLKMTPGPDLALRLLGRPEKENRNIVKGAWFDPSIAADMFHRHFARVTGVDAVRQMMEVDRNLWLVDESLKLADTVTMASGLEARVPFLDPRILAWSHATPSSWHVDFKRTKALLKDAYRSILPQHLFSLEKASFYPPLAKWIRRECAPLVEEALAGKRINEFFDTIALRKIFEDHKAHTKYGLHPLSSIMQLHFWFEEVYDA